MDVVQGFSIASLMDSMPVKLKSEECLNLKLRVGFDFTDIDKQYTVSIRRGVAEVVDRKLGNAQASVSVSSRVWKNIVTQQRNPVASLASGELQVDGSIRDLLHFLSLFERE